MTSPPLRNRANLLPQFLEAAAYLALGCVCLLATWALSSDGLIPDYAYLALSACLATGFGPLAWRLTGKAHVQDELAILLTLGFRFSVLLGALAISAATKWPHNNSFGSCLVGYYFPFLILQSALLIRSQSIQHPPQS